MQKTNTIFNNTLNTWWIIGFIDAEGNFNIRKEKIQRKNSCYYKIGYIFQMSLALKDIDLLYEIKKYLNMGVVYSYPQKSKAHYSIYRQNEVLKLIKLLEQYHFFTQNQSDKFLSFQYGVYKNIRKADTLEEIRILFQRPYNSFGYTGFAPFYKDFFLHKSLPIQDKFYENVEFYLHNWISGFITGEGSFYHNKTNKAFIFDIEQAEKEVLVLIHTFFSFSPNVSTRKKREQRKQTFCVRVSSKKDLSKLISFVLQNNSLFVSLKGYKKISFDKWLLLYNKSC